MWNCTGFQKEFILFYVHYEKVTKTLKEKETGLPLLTDLQI